MNSLHKSRGFTLIELLVVISVIGMLSSIVLASLNSARVKARDAERVQSINQLRNAIELYYNDTGHYPNTPYNGGTLADCWIPGGGNWIIDGDASLAASYNWSTGYISKQAHDPVDNCCWPSGNCGSAGTAGTYEYWSNGQKYVIAARLENVASPLRAQVTHPGITDPGCGLYENGGCWGLGYYVYAVGN